jgi:site-specific DNA recombinase
MVDKFKSGMSANALCDYLNKTNNDRVWHPNGVLRILKNPALYGSTRWNDKVIEYTHDGLITKQDFLKIQRMLDDRSLHHKREVQSIYLFQGCFGLSHLWKYINRQSIHSKEKRWF